MWDKLVGGISPEGERSSETDVNLFLRLLSETPSSSARYSSPFSAVEENSFDRVWLEQEHQNMHNAIRSKHPDFISWQPLTVSG
jgi:hypothetical protein